MFTGNDFPIPPSFEFFWRFTRNIQEQREATGSQVGDFIDRLNDMKNQLKKGEGGGVLAIMLSLS